MLRVSHGLLTMAILRWSGEQEARDASNGHSEFANPDGPGDGPVYEFTQLSDEPELRADRAICIQMDTEFNVPTVLGTEWAGMRWIGCNRHVYGLSPLLEMRTQIDLGSPFAGFRTDSAMTRLMVVSETGLTALATDGGVAWRVDLDVITDLRWRDEFVIVTQMDGPEVSVSLRNGAVHAE